MLKTNRALFEELNKNAIPYCHWKSNKGLDASLNGQGDLDILVLKPEKERFERLLNTLSFKKMGRDDAISHPSIAHFYGFDQDSGLIVHLHIYYEIITGGSLLKNYRLPFEEMVFKNNSQHDIVQIPSKAAELVLFVLRMAIKHGFIPEAILIARGYRQLREELSWLSEPGVQEEAVSLLKQYLPTLSPMLFRQYLEALGSRWHLLRCGILALRIQASLKDYTRYSTVRALTITYGVFFQKIIRRAVLARRGKALAARAPIIALVGPEASGKSTLAEEIKKWLGEYFAVYAVHAGIPPYTWLTFLGHLFIAAGKALFPQYRTSNIESKGYENGQEKRLKGLTLFIYALRSLMIAWDRSQLLEKINRLSRKGRLIICDRYPTTVVGAMDSPRLDPERYAGFIGALASLENRLYEKMPAADLVIKLNVPVEIALRRNITRNKKGAEGEDYIRRRHAQVEKNGYPQACVVTIDTEHSLRETVPHIKKVLWHRLSLL